MVEVSGVEAEIASAKIVVYSKSGCPFAGRTKEMLRAANVTFLLRELDQMNNGSDVQNKLKQISGQSTVPNIFIAGKHVGGNSEVQAAKTSGALKMMLDAAGVSNDL